MKNEFEHLQASPSSQRILSSALWAIREAKERSGLSSEVLEAITSVEARLADFPRSIVIEFNLEVSCIDPFPTTTSGRPNKNRLLVAIEARAQYLLFTVGGIFCDDGFDQITSAINLVDYSQQVHFSHSIAWEAIARQVLSGEDLKINCSVIERPDVEY